MSKLVISMLLCFSLFSVSLAVSLPTAYFNEEVLANFYPNGSLQSSSKVGYVDIEVPNDNDVLQYIRINLSSTSGTNLQSNQAYKGVAASEAGPGDLTRLFMNTTNDVQDVNYDITDDDLAPVFLLNVSFKNSQGGYDIYDSDNIYGPYNDVNYLNFTINITNPSATNTFNNINLELQFNKDTLAGADSVNITSAPTVDNGSVLSVDTDSDSYFDLINWTGSLSPGGTALINFNISVKETENFNGLNLNLNGFTTTKGIISEYANYSNSLTGIILDSFFSRGPVREGVDFLLAGNNKWRVRGFIENIANSTVANKLNYTVYNWSLYQVNNQTGEPLSNPNISMPGSDPSFLLPGERKYTQWFDTGSDIKPYYSPFFNWTVTWNNTSTSGIINTTMEVPSLYKIDIDNAQDVEGIIVPSDYNNLTVNITAKHFGDSSLDVSNITILSLVPHKSADNSTTYGNWDVVDSTVKVYFVNSTGEYELDQNDANLTVIINDPTINWYGNVTVEILDLEYVDLTAGGDLGHQLHQTESIRLVYNVSTQNNVIAGDEFDFNGTSLFWTEGSLGTPIQEFLPTVTLVASAKRLNAYKDLVALDPNNPTFINASIYVNATDKGGAQDGIAGIRLVDYVPQGTDFDLSNVTVRYYNSSASSWEMWVDDGEINIYDNGTIMLSDNILANAYEYVDNASNGTWTGTMYDGDVLEIKYQFNVTDEGLYTLPAQIAGFDPTTGADISATTYGVILVEYPYDFSEPTIVEGDFSLSKFISVGRPASWVKTFEVYNPNMRPMRTTFRTAVFRDVVSAYVNYYDSEGNNIKEEVDYEVKDGVTYAVWETTLRPYELRNYYIQVLTPAVMAVDRNVEVLGALSHDLVKLRLMINLKNFADEDYNNVRLYLPVRSEQIISVTDESGNELDYSEGINAVVNIPSMSAEGIKTVIVDFKESYPLVIVTPEKDEYDADSVVNMSIRIINGGMDVEHPYIEVEVYTPYLDTVYSKVAELNRMDAISVTEESQSFVIPSTAPTGSYVASVRFRENFNVISTGDAVFNVKGGDSSGSIISVLAVYVLLICVAYLGYRRVRKWRG